MEWKIYWHCDANTTSKSSYHSWMTSAEHVAYKFMRLWIINFFIWEIMSFYQSIDYNKLEITFSSNGVFDTSSWCLLSQNVSLFVRQEFQLFLNPIDKLQQLHFPTKEQFEFKHSNIFGSMMVLKHWENLAQFCLRVQLWLTPALSDWELILVQPWMFRTELI